MKKINNNEEAIELIIEEYDGELTADGKAELQKWINSHPENERTYREFLEVKNNLDILASYKELDADTSWEVLEQKLEPASDSKILSVRGQHKIWWLSAAAILICIISIVLYQAINSNILTLNTLANHQRQFRFPDGSSVTLNENTSIKYSEKGFGRTTELNLLHGEAFFEVVHDPGRVFQINMGDLRVTDIGTSFIVKRSASEISVMVNSGKVAFEHLSTGEHVILVAGEKGVFLTGTNRIIGTPNLDINYKSWVDKKLSFRNTPLSEVANELGKTYGTKVILNVDQLKKRTLSATLNYQTVDSALVVISASLQLKVHKADGQYILDYK